MLGPPRSSTGEVLLQRRDGEGGEQRVEDHHAHSSDKHADAHICAPPRRHSAIRVFVCYHILSGHGAAPPREFMLLGNAHLFVCLFVFPENGRSKSERTIVTR